MSDTTGWTPDSGGACYGKVINNDRYVIGLKGGWELFINREKISTHRTLALAKRAAHDHARSKE